MGILSPFFLSTCIRFFAESSASRRDKNERKTVHFGSGNAEYSCEDLKTAELTIEQVLGCLKFIICGYNDGKQNYLAFLDIDDEGSVGYSFFCEGSEEPVEVEDAEIVAANIYAIVSDGLVAEFDN